MPLVKANDFLWHPDKYAAKGVCAVFGKNSFFKSNVIRHLRNQILSDADAEFSFVLFDGQNAALKDVLSETSTTAMFGGGMKFVLIDDADKFVTKYRSELEKFAEMPPNSAILALQLTAFPNSTKLYKIIETKGLLVAADDIPDKDVLKWITQWSKSRYQIPCESDAADMLFQRVGNEPALLDQELTKLSLMADTKRGITAKMVDDLVGSWRSRTAFDMLDCALASQTAAAIRLLDKLFLAGENAVAIYAQIAATLRKLAMATEYITDAEKHGTKMPVKTALEKSGVKGFVLDKTEKQLINLGRERGKKMLEMLVELDLNLKGGSRSDPRQILETFLVGIASPVLRRRAVGNSQHS
jgi:DNA polymerase-3 subunit delta